MSITSSTKLQTEQTNKTKWKGECKSAISKYDLLTLHGKREKGKRKSQNLPISFLQEVGTNRGNFDSFRTAAFLLPPTKRFWPRCNPWTILCTLFSYLRLCSCTDFCHHIYILSSLQSPSCISTWLPHWAVGFPNCDTSTIPCMWDTPKLLLNANSWPLPLDILFVKYLSGPGNSWEEEVWSYFLCPLFTADISFLISSSSQDPSF